MPTPSKDGAPEMPMNDAGISKKGGITDSNSCQTSLLDGSFLGILRPQFYLITNGYPTVVDLALKSESIAIDVKNLRSWARRFDPMPVLRQYCDQEGFRHADDHRIRKALRHSPDHPTLFYSMGSLDIPVINANNPHEVAGHTHNRLDTDIRLLGGELAYLPSDCFEPSTPGQYKNIPYKEMRRILLRKPRSEALVFITETCYCDNFLQLPYVLEWDGSEIVWKPTEHHHTFPKDLGDIVHLAATSPDEPAACYGDIGALFTSALYCIDPREPLSLKAIGKQLLDNVAKIPRTPRESGDSVHIQHPKVYASREMDDPHFFQALGFYSPSDFDSNVGGDSDSDI